MAKKSRKDWTVLLFMAADNNLDYESIKDLKEIKTIGSTDRVNLLALQDRIGDRPAQLYYLTKGGHYRDDVQAVNLEEINTGDPTALVHFIKYAKRKFPAQHYLLIMWGHGAGVLDADYLTGGPMPTSILGAELAKQMSARLNPAKKLARKLHELSVEALLPQHEQLFRRTFFLPSKLSLLARDKRAKAIAIDYPNDEQLDYLDNRELQWAMGQARTILQQPVDILGFDACLMNMAEIAYQLRDSVQYLVGSQDLVTKEGFPYKNIFRLLTKNPDISARELAEAMVDYYGNAPLPNKKKDIHFRTLSACDLTTFNAKNKDSMFVALDELAQTMLHLCNNKVTDPQVTDQVRQVILEARGRSQYYDEGDYIDLYHFCELLIERGQLQLRQEKQKLQRINPNKNRVRHEEKKAFVRDFAQAYTQLKECCQRIHRLFGPRGLVFANACKGPLVKHSHGLSIYFPFKRLDPTYKATIVDFVQDSAWDKFLRVFVRQTQWLRFLEEFAHNPRTAFRIKIE